MSFTENRLSIEEPMANDGDVFVGQILVPCGAVDKSAVIAITKAGDVPGRWMSISTFEIVRPIRYKKMLNLNSKRGTTFQDQLTIRAWINENEKKYVQDYLRKRRN
jgi:hypothetical protein